MIDNKNLYETPPTIQELKDYLKEVAENPEIMSDQLSPSINIDYVTISIPKDERELSEVCIEELLQLYPECKIVYLDKEYSNFCKNMKGELPADQVRPKKEVVDQLRNQNSMAEKVSDSRLKANLVVLNRDGREIHKPT